MTNTLNPADHRPAGSAAGFWAPQYLVTVVAVAVVALMLAAAALAFRRSRRRAARRALPPTRGCSLGDALSEQEHAAGRACLARLLGESDG